MNKVYLPKLFLDPVRSTPRLVRTRSLRRHVIGTSCSPMVFSLTRLTSRNDRPNWCSGNRSPESPQCSFDSRLSGLFSLRLGHHLSAVKAWKVVPEWSFLRGTDANCETGAAADPEPKHFPLSRLLRLAMRLTLDLFILTKTLRIHLHQSTTA